MPRTEVDTPRQRRDSFGRRPGEPPWETMWKPLFVNEAELRAMRRFYEKAPTPKPVRGVSGQDITRLYAVLKRAAKVADEAGF